MIDTVYTPFTLGAQVELFQKSGLAEDRQRRIAGVISTEARDRQQEIVLQDGLDFSHFIKYGWFNDNHMQETGATIGYPETIQRFEKGQTLPNNKKAEYNCTWAEGYLLNTQRAREIWDIGVDLQKSGGQRGLSFSVEGSVQKRMGDDNKIVAKALVQNCAVTNCPVNPGASLECLVKSFFDTSEFSKALSVGNASPGTFISGPITGEGAGVILAKESLEGVTDDEDDKKKNKKIKISAARELISKSCPSMSSSDIERILQMTIYLSQRRCTNGM